ncbi:MAG: U32 family peptidase [Alphaproteobacteria bacterium]|nr:U32 family peptidase [Alphaproteobacteria bacterium]MCL2505980.1 U32 family peptidase [Alphaproteobacteria bacterium]
MELVCPAGTPAALTAAVNAGADTIYCGYNNCTNARNYPGLNFSQKEMTESISFAHSHGVKVLIAVNTFPKAGEEKYWHQALHDAFEAKADAVILADIGVLDYATKKFPKMRRHLSVQASAANDFSIAFYKEHFDIKRVVLPRILSIEEIKSLIDKTGLETEVFAFGSVGPMSEGRCFLSSYITGLSPTSEGVCAPASHVSYKPYDNDTIKSCLGDVTLNHFSKDEAAPYPTPCKGRYKVNSKSLYLFEDPVGLNAMDILSQLRDAGVTALKIEGRQRSKAYVAQTVAAFRKALDSSSHKSLARAAEGGSETFGAYKAGWK